MNRIYISGPITGTEDYMERFERVEENLKKLGYTSIINPAKINAMLPEDTEHEEYMQMSLTMLAMSDEIYLMEGWRDSRGCCMEYGYAYAAGIEIWRNGGLERPKKEKIAPVQSTKEQKPAEPDPEPEACDAQPAAGEAQPAAGEDKPAAGKEAAEEKVKKTEKKKYIDHPKIWALHKAGWTNKKIADEMGCAESTVCMSIKAREKGME